MHPKMLHQRPQGDSVHITTLHEASVRLRPLAEAVGLRSSTRAFPHADIAICFAFEHCGTCTIRR